MLTSMLEKAIEIEGLLRIIRDGKPHPETFILLNIKTAELAEQAAALEDKAGTHGSEIPHADFVMTPPAAPAPGVPEVVFSVQQPASPVPEADRSEETVAEIREDMPDLPLEDLALIEEDDIQLTFDDTIDITQPMVFSEDDAAPSESNVFPEHISKTEFIVKLDPSEGDGVDISKDFDQREDTVDSEASAIPEGNGADHPEDFEVSPVKDADAVTEETDASVGGVAPAGDTHAGEGTSAPKRKVRLRSAFSLNDRFLYARELFGGNMKMFDSTLDFIEGIEDYSIIEDYFYSELEWDPENPHVATFMEILRPHFKE